ncbi:MAG: phage major capsid protein [Planctomycetaceae bacterium]|nr:phage major capsid protein [Planctomycetaceae bacterium]
MQYDWTSAARHPGQTRSVLTTNGVDQVMAALQALPPEERHRVVRAAQGHTDLLKTMLGAPVGGQGQADEQRQLASEWLRAVMIAPRGLAANFAQTDVVRRALSSDVSEGGYLLPSYVTSLMAAPPVAPSLFPHVTKIPVGTGSGWVPTNSADLEFTWGDEGGSIDEISPSVGRCQFAIKKMSGLIRGSNE